jgi:hypothetical protein
LIRIKIEKGASKDIWREGRKDEKENIGIESGFFDGVCICY